MRISYTCPAHLKFSLTVEKWTYLTKITGEVIDWLDKHEIVYDVWLVTAYSATSCALVQVSLSFYPSPILILEKPLHWRDLLLRTTEYRIESLILPFLVPHLGSQGRSQWPGEAQEIA